MMEGTPLELQPRQPVLVYVMGQPATGRTTFAQQLSTTLQCPMVNHGMFLGSLMGPIQDGKIVIRSNDWVQDVLGYYFLKGLPVVFDANTFTKNARAPFLETARLLGIPTVGIWVQCDVASQKAFNTATKYPDALLTTARQVFEAPQVNEGFEYIMAHSTDLQGFGEIERGHDDDESRTTGGFGEPLETSQCFDDSWFGPREGR